MKSKEPTEPPGPDTLSYSGSLYHYTNLQGAKGILESGALWATDVSYLNDTSEYTYGGAIIRAALAEFQPDEWVSSLLDDLLAPDPRSLGYNIYAACFCEKPDLLSQWRAYSKSGVGYSLEFDRAHLTTLKRHWEHYLRFDQNEVGPA